LGEKDNNQRKEMTKLKYNKYKGTALHYESQMWSSFRILRGALSAFESNMTDKSSAEDEFDYNIEHARICVENIERFSSSLKSSLTMFLQNCRLECSCCGKFISGHLNVCPHCNSMIK
jgi:hypothetical protein